MLVMFGNLAFWPLCEFYHVSLPILAQKCRNFRRSVTAARCSCANEITNIVLVFKALIVLPFSWFTGVTCTLAVLFIRRPCLSALAGHSARKLVINCTFHTISDKGKEFIKGILLLVNWQKVRINSTTTSRLVTPRCRY